MKKIIIIGAGGHAGTIIEILLKRKEILKEDIKIVGILVEKEYLESSKKEFMGVPILGDLSKINDYKNLDYEYIIGIGDNEARERISEIYNHLPYYVAIHPSAVVASNAKIGSGTVVEANAVINTFARVGKHCILNTLSITGHDSVVEDYSHVSSNSALGGWVKIGKKCFIGLGSTVIPEIEIGENATVGAGAVVIKNVQKNSVVVGNPGRVIKIK
ncbi:acetyltransferase [Fusobacterium sp. MFO224]|uniref:acetyltransferase n=1 Tax=Fusobacterium sp. MFO224 TaxID=3378070 RepID=UPI0038555A66